MQGNVERKVFQKRQNQLRLLAKVLGSLNEKADVLTRSIGVPSDTTDISKSSDAEHRLITP